MRNSNLRRRFNTFVSKENLLQSVFAKALASSMLVFAGKLISMSLVLGLAFFMDLGAYGSFAYCRNLLYFLGPLSLLGLNVTLIPSVAAMHHSAEFEKISRLLHSTFYFSIIFSFAFTGILFVVAFLDVLDPIISNSLPLVGLTIPIFTAIAHLGNVCIGFGFPNYSFIPKYFIVPTATTIFVLIWLLYSAQLSTFAVMLSILLGYIAALHSQIIYLRICAPDSISQISFDYNIHFQYIRDSLPYFFVVLSRMVSNRFTLLALPFFVAVDQVGIFGFCITLISSILILTETSFSFFITRIVKFVSKNDNQNAAYELRKLRIFLIIFLIPIFSALVFVGPYIFGILFEETDLDWRILALLALGSIISALAGPLDRLCAAFKVVTPLLVFDIGSAIVTIAAAILLAGPFGLLGAAAAQVCGLAIKHLGRMWIIHYRVGLPL